MKDWEAREVINLLTKRLNQLDRQFRRHESPHPKDCKCDECEGYTPDFFIVTFARGCGWWTKVDKER